MTSPALVWLRRDLRLADNPALSTAVQRHARVIPVYIQAPDDWGPGAAQQVWLHHSLTALAADIAAKGSRLVIRSGPAQDTLQQLIRDTGACAVYWNRLYEPSCIQRDSCIKQALRSDGLSVESFKAALLHEPWEIATTQNGPYKVFTPFWRRVQDVEVPPALACPDTLPAVPHGIDSTETQALQLLPRIHWHSGIERGWHFGETAASKRLNAFLKDTAPYYKQDRDIPALPGTSALSPHLHFGEISPRQVWHAVGEQASGGQQEALDAFLRQIAWREFAHHLLYHFPDTPHQPMDSRFQAFPWAKQYADTLRAWQRAETGIPLVDAAMRQLWETGWMHNRMRMTVASLLTKNLRIPWQEGARWFEHTLVDADLANNTLGWQWSAGCGADAAPYFRILNPVRQGERFDSDGAYVRRWVPELADMPDRHIHAPWQAPGKVLGQAGIRLGKDYPEPIVDLQASRREALEAYQRIK